jgi:putative 4-mercaptohistidine N1-methyltranferase
MEGYIVAFIYETDAAVSQYCEAHYGATYFGVDHFPAKCARICLKAMKGRPRRKALDLGCAVGRSTFELARGFDRVTGLDFSARFIRIAVQLQENGVAHYQLPEEGELISYHEARLSDFSLEQMKDKVEFFQADAVNLKPLFSNYDLIFAGNLIDRLYDPGKFLSGVHKRLHVGGLLVVTSPYTWLAEFTTRDKWIGGFRKNGEPYTTLEGMQEFLREHFQLVNEPEDIEFVIRETRRKFQHTVAQLTVWERVS